jgi:hypothetical protein
MEINTQIHKVLDHGANPKPEASPAPLQEWVANTRVSLFGPVSAAYAILYFHRVHGLAQGLGGARSEPRSAKLPKDAMRCVANHALNEKMWAWKERRQARSAPLARSQKSRGRMMRTSLHMMILRLLFKDP